MKVLTIKMVMSDEADANAIVEKLQNEVADEICIYRMDYDIKDLEAKKSGSHKPAPKKS